MTSRARKTTLFLTLLLLGGCAGGPTTVALPGRTVGLLSPWVVVTHYHPVVYPARSSASATAAPAAGGGAEYPEYLLAE